VGSVAVTGRRFVFVDRDGTINVERPGAYVLAADDMRLLPGAAVGLRRLRDAGLGLVVVSNQAPVARGWIGPDDLDAVNSRMLELLADDGVTVDGVYCCPHDDGDGCGCRKPEPGLLLRAAGDLGFDTGCAFVVGDKGSDLEAGRRVGATTILVRTGQGAAAEESGVPADAVAEDLRGAADIIAGLVAADGVPPPAAGGGMTA
jgi:D-glycero-D-manno-heptose 1,7-bisphosphate phosphatase